MTQTPTQAIPMLPVTLVSTTSAVRPASADDSCRLLGSTRGVQSIAVAGTPAAHVALAAAAYVAVAANAGFRGATGSTSAVKQVERPWTTGGRARGSVPWSPPV